MLMRCCDRTLVHLDADAQMGTYEAEGKTRSSLSLIQRKFPPRDQYFEYSTKQPQDKLMCSLGQRAKRTLPRPKLKRNRLLVLRQVVDQVEFGLYIMFIPLQALDMGLALLQLMVCRELSPLLRRSRFCTLSWYSNI
jgi:hypothetical protein